MGGSVGWRLSLDKLLMSINKLDPYRTYLATLFEKTYNFLFSVGMQITPELTASSVIYVKRMKWLSLTDNCNINFTSRFHGVLSETQSTWLTTTRVTRSLNCAKNEALMINSMQFSTFYGLQIESYQRGQC